MTGAKPEKVIKSQPHEPIARLLVQAASEIYRKVQQLVPEPGQGFPTEKNDKMVHGSNNVPTHIQGLGTRAEQLGFHTTVQNLATPRHRLVVVAVADVIAVVDAQQVSDAPPEVYQTFQVLLGTVDADLLGEHNDQSQEGELG